MQTNRSWSIDDKRYNFQFGCEIGWEIKSGKRVRMVKNPSYSGITTEFWNSLDAICSRDEWTLWGTPNCGKGQPQQVMGTGHGAAPSRFRGIKVGARSRASSPQRTLRHRVLLSNSMLTREQAGDIFDRIKKLSSADEVEVLFSGGRFALTRFANNTIHQNVAEENYIVSVRTVFGGRTARAFTNKFDDESLRQVVRSSESLAKVQHPDPDLLPMPDRARLRAARAGAPAPHTPPPSRHFQQTAAITPELRAEGVKKIVGVAEQHKLTTAGVFSSGESIDGIFNSRGLSRWHTQTSAEISITMLAADSSGWQKANSPDVANLDPLALAEIAAKKALDSARPREIPAGKYTVILEPAAVLDIVGLHVLGLLRHGDSRPALVSQRTHRHEVVRRQHHHLG